MNFKLNSLFISLLLLLSTPAFADIPGIEASGVNPLDKKTEFLNNHLIAFSEIKVNNETKKFIALIPDVGSKEIVVYEVNPSTNKLTESATFTENLHAPFYITFDPSGLHLYGVSSTRNFVTQYTFDPVRKKYVSSDESKSTKLINTAFQTACRDNYFFLFDYYRTIQFFPSENKAYITCEDKSSKLYVVGYQFDSKTGALKIPDISLAKEDKQGAGESTKVKAKMPEMAGQNLVEVANPLAILMGPLGRYLYAIDHNNVWHQYKLSQNGHFELTGESFKTEITKIESMTFDPSGENVYVVARDSAGGSIIVQYKFDQSSGKLEKLNSVTIPKTDAQIKVRARTHATYIQFAPAGNYAYVLDRLNNLIYQYRVESKTGKLIALNPAAFITCSIVRSLVFDSDPSRHYAYAAASERKTLEPKPETRCEYSKYQGHDPYELHIDQLVVDPATGQLANFAPD